MYANELEIVDGKLTGRHLGDIVDGKRKAELLKIIAQVENINIAQTIAVGDGVNDLPMLSTAGLGIAFHAKPKVKQTARQSDIHHPDWTACSTSSASKTASSPTAVPNNSAAPRVIQSAITFQLSSSYLCGP